MSKYLGALILGSKQYTNLIDFSSIVSNVLIAYEESKDPKREIGNVELITEGGQGIDALARIYANTSHYKLTEFPAQWEIYGDNAGKRRDLEMIDRIKQYKYSIAIVFWEEGNKHIYSKLKMIKLANIEYIVYSDKYQRFLNRNEVDELLED